MLSENGLSMSAAEAHSRSVTASPSPPSHGSAATPLGRMRVTTADDALVGLHFDTAGGTPDADDDAAHERATIAAVRSQLDEYFRGIRMRFDLPFRLDGTPFQQEVWAAVMEIPYGQTSTYARVAEALGRPQAVRAVGAANGRNPISIVVPCHRLIGTGGSLTGYGGGLDRKRALLDLEMRTTSGVGGGAGSPEIRTGGRRP